MAVEWNYNSVMEVYLKIKMASAVKLIISKIDNKSEAGILDILDLNIPEKESIMQVFEEIRNFIEKEFYDRFLWFGGDSDEEVEPETDLENYNMDVPYCQPVRNICGLNMDLEYYDLETLLSEINNDSNVFMISNYKYAIEEDLEYELDKCYKRHVKMTISADVIEKISEIEDIKLKELIISLVADIYMVDWYAISILDGEMVLYAEYDLDMLGYNMRAGEVHTASYMARRVVILYTIQEYMKKIYG